MHTNYSSYALIFNALTFIGRDWREVAKANSARQAMESNLLFPVHNSGLGVYDLATNFGWSV